MTLVLSLTSDLTKVQRGQVTFLGSHRRLPSLAASLILFLLHCLLNDCSLKYVQSIYYFCAHCHSIGNLILLPLKEVSQEQ